MEKTNVKTGFPLKRKAITGAVMTLAAAAFLVMEPITAYAQFQSTTEPLYRAKGGGRSKESAMNDAKRKLTCPTLNAHYVKDAKWDLALMWYNNTWFSADIVYKCPMKSPFDPNPKATVTGTLKWKKA